MGPVNVFTLARMHTLDLIDAYLVAGGTERYVAHLTRDQLAAFVLSRAA